MKFISLENRYDHIFIICCALSLLSTGCATLISGKTQVVRVNSDPPNAEVIVDSQVVGRTPCDISLQRKSAHSLVLRSENGRQQIMDLEKGTNPWVYLDALGFPVYFITGLAAAYYDFHSGAAYEYIAIKPKLENAASGQQ